MFWAVVGGATLGTGYVLREWHLAAQKAAAEAAKAAAEAAQRAAERAAAVEAVLATLSDEDRAPLKARIYDMGRVMGLGEFGKIWRTLTEEQRQSAAEEFSAKLLKGWAGDYLDHCKDLIFEKENKDEINTHRAAANELEAKHAAVKATLNSLQKQKDDLDTSLKIMERQQARGADLSQMKATMHELRAEQADLKKTLATLEAQKAEALQAEDNLLHSYDLAHSYESDEATKRRLRRRFYDTDEDNVVSFAEYATIHLLVTQIVVGTYNKESWDQTSIGAMADLWFMVIDNDKNGYVTEDEVISWHKELISAGLFEVNDKYEENYIQNLKADFRMYDTNGDGKLDKAEVVELITDKHDRHLKLWNYDMVFCVFALDDVHDFTS